MATLLDPTLARLRDELVAQKADPALLRDWTTERRKDGTHGTRLYYVDPQGKAHRSAPAARRAILHLAGTPPKKRKTQDKDRSQLVKWKLSGCTVAVTPAPPRTEANEEELALEGQVFEDEGTRWRVDEVYFDETVQALCAAYYDFDARGFVPPYDEDASEMTPLQELGTFATWVREPVLLTGEALQTATKREHERLDARRASRIAWDCIDALHARRLKRQPAWPDLPVCAVGDRVKCAQLMETHGVVVFRNVLSTEEVKAAEGRFWDWAEKAAPGLHRHEFKTHAMLGSLGYADTGVVCKKGVSQSEFMWGVRCARGHRDAWATVLGTEDLCASFDGAGAWLNPHVHDEHVITKGKWYHIDQFYGKTPERKGFQGLVTLYDADANTGSFVCLPGSHKDYEKNCRGRNPLGNFVRMGGKRDADYCAFRAVQVAPLGPGDLVVWDSRVVHCSAGVDINADPSTMLRGAAQPPLSRLVAYVACAPQSEVSEVAREKRREAVRKGYGGNAFSSHDHKTLRRAETPAGYRAPPEGGPVWGLV